MATVHYSGDANTWQEAFEPEVERITRYFGRCFRRCLDPDESVQEALCLAVRHCRHFWRVGLGHTQYLGFIVRAVFKGQGIVSRPHRDHRSIQTRLALMDHHQAARKPAIPAEVRRDFWLDIQQLGEHNAAILHLLAAGESWYGIAQTLKTAQRQVPLAIRAAQLLMQD